MAESSFQDQIKENHCWGCGPANEHGLRIKSYWSGEEAVCTWQPGEQHSAGPLEILNGGVIATLFDCHCVCTAIAAAYRAESREDRLRALHLVRDRVARGQVPPPDADR